jgi:transmembrane sensor
MDTTRLEYLFDCFISSKCSMEEEKEFMNLLDDPQNEEAVKNLIDRLFGNGSLEQQMPENISAGILKKILKKDEAAVVPFERKIRNFAWMKVAAMIVLFLSATYLYIRNNNSSEAVNKKIATTEKPLPLTPGGNHAVLTMADGTKILLDSLENGKIQHGNLNISKKNGLLVFNAGSHNTIENLSYNTLSTPKGGQYKVILADGSEVWLNASSSLRFPTAFKGDKREVELKGEGYFEVAKNKAKPFYVKVGGMSIKVLGTHFNVSAYSDNNAIKTSLLEGSVKITEGKTEGLLRPGEQGILIRNKENLEIRKFDMEEVMAWKNGLFQFKGADIITIMNEISRWYDVDVIYSGKVPVRHFEGKISREAALPEVLKILELSNVKFKVEGKKIIVE